jgi:peptidoglycan/LPS O-acetylase OafA/YrhL
MERLTRMDGLRGVLAVYVMLGHVLPFTVLPGWLVAPFSHGEAAVDLFFGLSGLVILNSLERFGGAFWPFMAARARRLLPVYFIVLGLACVLVAAGDPLPEMRWLGAGAGHIMPAGLPPEFLWHLAAHVVLLQGVIPQSVLPYAYVTLLGPAWSLSTEWQFYVLVGILGGRAIGVLALALLACGALYHVVMPAGGGEFSRAFLPDAAPYFALGLASAVWLRGGGFWVFLACVAGACGLGVSAAPEKAMIPLIWALAVLAQRHRWGGVLDHPWVLYLGAISYPLYLVNEPVARLAAMWVVPRAHGDGRWFTLVWLPLVLVLCLAAAVALHHGVERRFMRQRKKKLLPVIAVTMPR